MTSFEVSPRQMESLRRFMDNYAFAAKQMGAYVNSVFQRYANIEGTEAEPSLLKLPSAVWTKARGDREDAVASLKLARLAVVEAQEDYENALAEYNRSNTARWHELFEQDEREMGRA